ncbi:MAG TPA: hypothetical protein VGC22_12555 [Chitinophaga sp.]
MNRTLHQERCAVPVIIFFIVNLYFIKTKKSIILDSSKTSLVIREKSQDNINQNLIPNLEAGIYLSHAIAVSNNNLLVYCSHLLPPVAGRTVNQLQPHKALHYYKDHHGAYPPEQYAVGRLP